MTGHWSNYDSQGNISFIEIIRCNDCTETFMVFVPKIFFSKCLYFVNKIQPNGEDGFERNGSAMCVVHLRSFTYRFPFENVDYYYNMFFVSHYGGTNIGCRDDFESQLDGILCGFVFVDILISDSSEVISLPIRKNDRGLDERTTLTRKPNHISIITSLIDIDWISTITIVC